MKASLLFLFVFAAATVFAQDYKELAEVEFTTKTDYAAAEKSVYQQCERILSGEKFDSDQAAMNMFTYLSNWVDENPKYNFTFNSDNAALYGKSPQLISVMLAAKIKLAVEGKPDTDGSMAREMFLNYCRENKKSLKKMLKENAALREALG